MVLTSDGKREAAEIEQNEHLSAILRDLHWRTGKTGKDLCDEIGISRPTVKHLRNPATLNSVKFGTVRRAAHAAKMSKSEWLKLGGYK